MLTMATQEPGYEVVAVNSIYTRVHWVVATRSMFFFNFSEKRHKIVEIFALLTTELSSYKMCKVGIFLHSLGFNLM